MGRGGGAGEGDRHAATECVGDGARALWRGCARDAASATLRRLRRLVGVCGRLKRVALSCGLSVRLRIQSGESGSVWHLDGRSVVFTNTILGRFCSFSRSSGWWAGFSVFFVLSGGSSAAANLRCGVVVALSHGCCAGVVGSQVGSLDRGIPRLGLARFSHLSSEQMSMWR